MKPIVNFIICFCLLGCSVYPKLGQSTEKGGTVIERGNFVSKTPTLDENLGYLGCLKRQGVDITQKVTESKGYGHLYVYSLLNDTLALVISTDDEKYYENQSQVLNKCTLEQLNSSSLDSGFVKEIKLYVFDSKVSLKDIMPNCYMTQLPKHRTIVANNGSILTATSGIINQRYMDDYKGGWKVGLANGGFLCSMYLKNVKFGSGDQQFLLNEHFILDVYAGWYAG